VKNDYYYDVDYCDGGLLLLAGGDGGGEGGGDDDDDNIAITMTISDIV